VQRVNWVSIAAPTEPIKVSVQIRYRSEAVGATLIPLGAEGKDERLRIVFDEPQFGVTPGQAAVWYDGDQVLGGGLIETATALIEPASEVKASVLSH
jgi:tRNA-specific 2-thiouridylase